MQFKAANKYYRLTFQLMYRYRCNAKQISGIQVFKIDIEIIIFIQESIRPILSSHIL